MITIEPINDDNVWKVCNLQVSESQRDFVATNEQSIIEAYTTIIQNKIALPYALKHNEDTVGFVMLGYDRIDADDPAIADGNYCLWRYMIDAKCQGKGYGRAGIEAVLEFIKSAPVGEAKACWLSYEPENSVAQKLYASFGFEETGEICSDELVAVKVFD
ncbi:GNAT family N-acetyltransferase [Erysipelothrix sp. HDW6C]|uniref:GNAT family N-acetyltransferase n=1 Tax=Erysipelothrix sp. HDW6C TaxID=2714930 RepID=UPI001408BBB5|nr:GNAT family N-acetyltransferase [Erysipelothrix sp. HDW6C]QIK70510.1 GNAT family N-acetyltransferase [Erysipelothrix sp. HDW6C]